MLKERDIGIAKQLFIGFLCLRTMGTPRFHESTPQVLSNPYLLAITVQKEGKKVGGRCGKAYFRSIEMVRNASRNLNHLLTLYKFTS